LRLLTAFILGDVAREREDIEFGVGEDDVAALPLSSAGCCHTPWARSVGLTAKNSRNNRYCPSLKVNSKIRSVPTCDTDVKRLVFRHFRNRATKAEGAAAVVRPNSVRCVRKPVSTTSCFLLSGLANFMRRILEDKSYMLDRRKLTKLCWSSCAMTYWIVSQGLPDGHES
jgi:hypothetical protein